ncbi:MAG: hypothetical protein ABIG60_04425 [Patescibacteria group bacterium]
MTIAGCLREDPDGIVNKGGFFTFSSRRETKTAAKEKKDEIGRLKASLGFHSVSGFELANHVSWATIQRISWIDWGIQKWYGLDDHFQYLVDCQKLMKLKGGKFQIIPLIRKYSSFSEKAEEKFRAFCERKRVTCY